MVFFPSLVSDAGLVEFGNMETTGRRSGVDNNQRVSDGATEGRTETVTVGCMTRADNSHSKQQPADVVGHSKTRLKSIDDNTDVTQSHAATLVGNRPRTSRLFLMSYHNNCSDLILGTGQTSAEAREFLGTNKADSGYVTSR